MGREKIQRYPIINEGGGLGIPSQVKVVSEPKHG
jgi:hypothetical protein